MLNIHGLQLKCAVTNKKALLPAIYSMLYIAGFIFNEKS